MELNRMSRKIYRPVTSLLLIGVIFGSMEQRSIGQPSVSPAPEIKYLHTKNPASIVERLENVKIRSTDELTISRNNFLYSANRDSSLTQTTRNFHQLESHTKIFYELVFSANGRQIIATSSNNIRLWNIDNQPLTESTISHTFSDKELSSTDLITETQINDENTRVITASKEGRISVWEISFTQSEPSHPIFSWKAENANDISISNDGNHIVVGQNNGDIVVFGSNGTREATLSGHEKSVKTVKFSPDGEYIASGDADGTIKLWDLQGNEINKLQSHSQNLKDIHISQDKQTIAIQDSSGKVNLINKSDGQILATLGSFHNQVKDFEFSTSELYSVTYKDRVELLDEENQLVDTFHCKSGTLSTSALRADGNTVAIGCNDGTIEIYDVRTGALVKKLIAHNTAVTRLSFSLSGIFLLSGSKGGVMKLWLLVPHLLTTLITVLLAGTASVIVLLFRSTRVNVATGYSLVGVWKVILPESWRGDLESLRYELHKCQHKSEIYTQVITVITLLDMLLGGVRMKVENLLDPNTMMAASGNHLNQLQTEGKTQFDHEASNSDQKN